LTQIGIKYLSGNLHQPTTALLGRVASVATLQSSNETINDAAVRIIRSMAGGCLIVQGPPGTGKTYTAALAINALLTSRKKVSVTSNSHKAVLNMHIACSEAVRKSERSLQGVKVGGEDGGQLFEDNPDFQYIEDNKEALAAYTNGIIGGTAWLFSRLELESNPDFLFIDEAGQVLLANVVAMARSAKNIALLGDQMQLEQPIQGAHPGDVGLYSLNMPLRI
jgi:uncharacterized protein